MLGLPSAAALLIGAAIGTVREWGFFVDSAVAVALVLPVTIASHKLTAFWMRLGPFGTLLGVLVKVILRTLVIVGGGLAIYLSSPEFKTRGVSLWVWLIGVYLSTLAVELYWLVASTREGGNLTR